MGLEMDMTREISDQAGAERSDLSKTSRDSGSTSRKHTHTCSDAVKPQASHKRQRHVERERNPCSVRTGMRDKQHSSVDTIIQTDQEISNATIAKQTRGSGGTREDRHPPTRSHQSRQAVQLGNTQKTHVSAQRQS